jgi:HK97 family phage prohead protease
MENMDARVTLKTKDYAPSTVSVKSETDLVGKFSGIANAFGVVDSYGDVTLPGCFAASIRARPVVPVLWCHDTTQPLGLARNLRETSRGLEFDGTLILAVEKAREAFALLKGTDRVPVLAFSIGYETVLSHFDKSTGNRMLDQLAVLEISVTPLPANDRSVLVSLDDAKSLDAVLRKITHEMRELKGTRW